MHSGAVWGGKQGDNLVGGLKGGCGTCGSGTVGVFT